MTALNQLTKFRYFRFILWRWQNFAGGVAMRLHLLPSLVLPAQRTFFTTFFFATFFLAGFFFAFGIHNSLG